MYERCWIVFDISQCSGEEEEEEDIEEEEESNDEDTDIGEDTDGVDSIEEDMLATSEINESNIGW